MIETESNTSLSQIQELDQTDSLTDHLDFKNGIKWFTAEDWFVLESDVSSSLERFYQES